MTEGDLHKKAVRKLAKYLRAKGYKVETDKNWGVKSGDRVSNYYPDITATKTIVIEVNGNVGHSSKRSYDNELNQKQFFELQDIHLHVYSPEEITGKGWTDSKGNKHRPHKPAEFYDDWKI